MTAWDDEQRMRDLQIADWYIWAASHRLQQASRELAIHSHELNYFEDSFALQLALLQQHARSMPTMRQQEGPVHAALVERAQTMIRISRMLSRAVRRLSDQAQGLEQMTTTVYRVTEGLQDPPAN